MRMITLMLLASISLLGCNEPPVLEGTCVPSSAFGKAYCNNYSLKDMKWEKRKFEAKPISAVDDAICISKEAFLKKLKPWMKDQDRRKKRKKRIIIDDHMWIRNAYEL